VVGSVPCFYQVVSLLFLISEFVLSALFSAQVPTEKTWQKWLERF